MSDVAPIAPVPSGRSQTEIVLHGTRYTRANGTQVTAPIATTPAGALKFENVSQGLTGGFTFKDGDFILLRNGAIIGWQRKDGTPVTASPGVG